MSDRIVIVAEAPDEHMSALFRAEVLKLTALYGVQVTQLTSGERPTLTVLPGGHDSDGAA